MAWEKKKKRESAALLRQNTTVAFEVDTMIGTPEAGKIPNPGSRQLTSAGCFACGVDDEEVKNDESSLRDKDIVEGDRQVNMMSSGSIKDALIEILNIKDSTGINLKMENVQILIFIW